MLSYFRLYRFYLSPTCNTMSSAKKSSGSKKSKGNEKNTTKSTKESPIGPISLNKTGNIIIKIHAKPGAKQNSVTDIIDEAIGVQIAAPPVDGEANTELVKYIAKVLQLRKSDVSVDRGSKSREKTILIDKSADITVDKVIEFIRKESTNS